MKFFFVYHSTFGWFISLWDESLISLINNTFYKFSEYPDGTGFDLSSVITGDNNFIEAITVQNFAFFFNPCGDTDKLPDRIKINDTDNECKKDKYSVCVYDQVKNKTVVLGRSENVRFQSSENTIDLVYPVKGQLYDDTQKTVISLQCAPNAMSSYLYAPLEPINITGEVVSETWYEIVNDSITLKISFQYILEFNTIQ